MGFCKQLVGASRVGRNLTTEPEFYVSGSAFGTDTITVNNRSINLFTAALNYKFGGWGY
jgi:hypothetical protein